MRTQQCGRHARSRVGGVQSKGLVDSLLHLPREGVAFEWTDLDSLTCSEAHAKPTSRGRRNACTRLGMCAVPSNKELSLAAVAC